MKAKKKLSRQAEYQASLRRRGICPRCGSEPMEEGYGLCAGCRIIANAAALKRYHQNKEKKSPSLDKRRRYI